MAVSATRAMQLLIGTSLGSHSALRNSAVLPVHRPGSVSPRASASSPPQQDEQGGNPTPSDTFKLEPVKKQQRRRSQWSKGDGPGEYGGPPLDIRIRPSWGGKSEDPLTANGEYIWQKNWQPFVEAPESDIIASAAPNAKEADSGFLSLNRAIGLDRMDVDLSQELMKPSKATLQRQLELASRVDAAATEEGQALKPRWRLAPTRREEEMWAKGRKAATGGSSFQAVMAREVDLAADAERQRQWYAELKWNLQLLTLGIGGLGTTCAYLAYSPEIAGSYGVGLVGAVVYIRMLGNSIDGLGATSAGGAARGALGSPRLLIPAVLVMIYNRWNTLLVPEYGLMHLDLIPMLLGFFTYKAATLVETFKELLPSPAVGLKEDEDLS